MMKTQQRFRMNARVDVAQDYEPVAMNSSKHAMIVPRPRGLNPLKVREVRLTGLDRKQKAAVV
jgi:hypothetical protein